MENGFVTSASLTEHQSSQNSKEEKNKSANPQKTTPSSPVYAVHLFFFHFAVNRNQNSLSMAKAFFGGVWSSAIKHK